MYRYTYKRSGHQAAFFMKSYVIEQSFHQASTHVQCPAMTSDIKRVTLYSIIADRFFSQRFFKLGLFAMGDTTARCRCNRTDNII